MMLGCDSCACSRASLFSWCWEMMCRRSGWYTLSATGCPECLDRARATWSKQGGKVDGAVCAHQSMTIGRCCPVTGVPVSLHRQVGVLGWSRGGLDVPLTLSSRHHSVCTCTPAQSYNHQYAPSMCPCTQVKLVCPRQAAQQKQVQQTCPHSTALSASISPTQAGSVRTHHTLDVQPHAESGPSGYKPNSAHTHRGVSPCAMYCTYLQMPLYTQDA